MIELSLIFVSLHLSASSWPSFAAVVAACTQLYINMNIRKITHTQWAAAVASQVAKVLGTSNSQASHEQLLSKHCTSSKPTWHGASKDYTQ